MEQGRCSPIYWLSIKAQKIEFSLKSLNVKNVYLSCLAEVGNGTVMRGYQALPTAQEVMPFLEVSEILRT